MAHSPQSLRLRSAIASGHALPGALVGGHVAFTSESFGERLFESVGRSHRDLPGTLGALACALVSHARLQSLHMHLDDIGSLTVERQTHEPVSHWEAPSEAFATATTVASNSELDHEISYAGRKLGRMRARTMRACATTGPFPDLLPQFARQCGRLVMRDRLEKWSLGRLGQPLRLIGLSGAMRDLDRFVEIASTSPLPVLLHGEFGTEKLAAAAAIHCSGPRPEQPFVAVDCSDPDGAPADWLKRSKGGTLYLSAIDRLSSPLQSALPRHVPSRLALWPHTGSQRAPRIIASTTLELAPLVAEGRFSRELAIELSVLEARVPPLRERNGDIAALMRDAIARLGYDADEKITQDLLSACLAYTWPENCAELERLLARLATMTGAAPIDALAIRRHAPLLATGQSEPPHTISLWTPPGITLLDRWALRAIDPDDDFPELEDALAKALRHMGARFEEAIDLAELAAIGEVAPQRMSELFRAAIGVSFKKLLRQIRILAACERLVQQPATSITQLAFQVGFGDLSYFERSFRSAIGESPRQFRQRRFGEQARLPSLLSDSAEQSSASIRSTLEAE
jgi:DNA-binding NtrC family response regulator